MPAASRRHLRLHRLWCELYAQTRTTGNSYFYIGQQYDASTGDYYLRAFYYSSNEGRFLSRDTYAYNYQNSTAFNRYGYMAGNPINHYDPSGNFAAAIEYINVNSG
jgi:RHS repeat-associated protein